MPAFEIRTREREESCKRASYVEIRYLAFVSCVCFLVIALASAWLIAQTALTSPPSPIASYPVTPNGTNVLVDSSTNQLNGSIPTNFTVAYGPGPATNAEAIYFAPGMTATIPTTNALSSSYFSFSTWYRNSTNTVSVSPLVSGSDIQTNQWSLYTDTNGVPNLALSVPNAQNQVQIVAAAGSTPINDGYWHFISAVLQTNSVQLYVDNNESQATVEWSGQNNDNIQLGSTNSAYSGFILSGIELFNSPLSSDQVSSVGSGITPSPGSINPASSSATPGSSSPGTSGATGQTSGIQPDVSGNLFTIYAGNLQIIAPSTFASSALETKLTTSTGTAISGASIKFTVATGSDGGLATTNGGTTASTQTVTTNSSGIAIIYYKSGTDLLKNNLITATDTADSLTVTFTERCGTQTGLVSWFAADQVAGTGVALPANSSSILSWTDLALTNTVTTTSQYAPTFISSDTDGKPSVHFVNNQGLSNTATTGLTSTLTGDMTIIFIGTTTSQPSQQYAAWVGGTGVTGAARGIAYYNSEELADGDSAIIQGANAAGNNVPVVEMWTYKASSTQVSFYQNGLLSSGPTTISNWTNPTVASLGIGVIPGLGYNWQGNLQEVLIYDQQLTTAQLAAINQYIGDKYLIYTPNATWCTNTSTYTTAEIQEIAKNQWNQAQANAYKALQTNAGTTGVYPTGLISWFNANSITGSTGTSVTSWTDSAVGNNVAAGGATSPVLEKAELNSNNAVRFNGQNWFYSSQSLGAGIDSAALTGNNPGMTVITVAINTQANGNGYSAWLGGGGLSPSGRARAMGYTSSFEFADFDSFRGPGTQNTTGSPSSGNWTTEEYTATGLPGSSNTIGFLQNGTTAFSSSIPNPQPLTSGITIGGVNNGYLQPFTNTPFGWTGDIAEVLVYDHPLSATEQAAVGKYLGNKYNIYDPNATWYNTGYTSAEVAEIKKNQWNQTQANAYKALQANTSGVYPTGLISWFDASTLTGSTGSSVTTWSDGALGNNVTAGGSTAPILESGEVNTHNAVRFNGANWFYSAQSIASGINSAAISGNNPGMTIITVANNSQPNGNGYSAWLGGGGLYPSGRARGMGYTGSLEFADFDSYRGPGKQNTTGSPSSANWTSEEYTVTGLPGSSNTIGFLQNGTTVFSSSIPNPQSMTSGITIGGVNNGYLQPYSNTPFGWTGDIAEVLVYDHPLSAAEQEAVGKYLGNKYNIYDPNATWYSTGYTTAEVAEIKKNQWNQTLANAYKTLQANTSGVYTTGLISWFDAGSITGSTGSSVTTWTDGALGNNVTAGGATAPVLESGELNAHNAVRFNGQNWFYSTSSLGAGINSAAISGNNPGMTIITVGYTNQPNSPEYSAWLGGAGVSPRGEARGIGYSNSAELADFDTYYNSQYATGSNASGNWATEEYTATGLPGSSNTIGFLQNGKTAFSSSIPDPQPLTSGITIGGTSNSYIQPYTNTPVGWSGDIAEVLVYDHPLSATEQAAVGKYLGNKYDLYDPNATWYNTGYTTAEISEIGNNQWGSAQATAYKTLQSNTSGVVTAGLISWFKADVGVATSGSGVTSWTDSAIGNVVQSSATEPTYITRESTGEPGVRFSGSNWLYSTASLTAGTDTSSGLTLIAVLNSSDPNATQTAFALGTSGHNTTVRGLTYANSDQYLTTWSDDATGAAVPQAEVFNIEGITLNGPPTAATFYRNGSVTAGPVNLPSTAGVVTPGITVGGVAANTTLWQGDISEILVYDHTLTTSDMATLTTYLSKKYGFLSFSKPSGTSSSTPLSVTINNIPTGAKVYYTTNGTAPAPSTTAAAWTNALPNPASPFTKLYTAGQALNITGSCPVQAAAFVSYTDENGVTDYQQVGATITAQYYVADTNDIGVTNAWQTTYGLSLTAATVNNLSSSGSGLTYLQDYLLGYNPTLYSTNGDGLSDLQNYQLGYSATQTNISGDGHTNAYDLANGIDPFQPYVAPTPPTPQSGHTLTVTITLPTGQ